MNDIDKATGRRFQCLFEIGDFCILCKTKKRIEFHEIRGKEHPKSFLFILNHKEDFVPLCWHCHRIVHSWCRMNEEKLHELANLLPKERPAKRRETPKPQYFQRNMSMV